jgi:hypothetical protein
MQLRLNGFAFVTLMLTLPSMAYTAASSFAAERKSDFLVPQPTSAWDNNVYKGRGFLIRVQRSNALPRSATIGIHVTVVEADPKIVPALDRIRLVSPCGPSASKNGDGTFWYSRDDETHYERVGVVKTRLGQAVADDPWLNPKGTYSFVLYLSADPAKIQNCSLRLSGAFKEQNEVPVPDILFRRINNVPDPQQPVP